MLKRLGCAAMILFASNALALTAREHQEIAAKLSAFIKDNALL